MFRYQGTHKKDLAVNYILYMQHTINSLQSLINSNNHHGSKHIHYKTNYCEFLPQAMLQLISVMRRIVPETYLNSIHLLNRMSS